jgi:nucleoside-diphosphate-sugar epimerase
MASDLFLPLCVIIGGAGFVGQRLLTVLAAFPPQQVRVLVHQKMIALPPGGNMQIVEGDLLNPTTLDGLIEPGCTVINLSYLTTMSASENITAMANLVEACRQGGACRLIHCSTAVVAGRTGGTVVDENTVCKPVSEYEKTKLKIERFLLAQSRGFFEVVILRPTAIFGPGGQNLLKLIEGLTKGKVLYNYFKSCLFNRRSMNLVCLDNVVAALLFLADRDEGVDEQIFIISDDDSPLNNYRDVESHLIDYLGLAPYPISRIALPVFFLRFFLRLSGRPFADPEVKFNAAKISAWGFKKSCTLRDGLDVFADWYKNEFTPGSQKNTK